MKIFLYFDQKHFLEIPMGEGSINENPSSLTNNGNKKETKDDSITEIDEDLDADDLLNSSVSAVSSHLKFSKKNEVSEFLSAVVTCFSW